MDAIGLSEIAAGAEPAHRNGKTAKGLAHDVSILLDVGRQVGRQPRANTSMTIMRAPQHGHGQGSMRGAPGAIRWPSVAIERRELAARRNEQDMTSLARWQKSCHYCTRTIRVEDMP